MTVLACLLLFSSGLAAETNVNLLANGDFEQGKLGKTPSRWAKMGWGPSRISLTESGPERAGKRVARIVSNGVSWHFIGQAVEVERGQRYRLRWRGKTDGKVGGQVQVRGYRPGHTSPWGPKNARVLVRKSFTGGDWRSYSFEFTPRPKRTRRPKSSCCSGRVHGGSKGPGCSTTTWSWSRSGKGT